MKVIKLLLSLQAQIRLWHWLTKSYAQHLAFGKTYESLDDRVDRFVEVYLGKNKDIPVESETSIKFYDLDLDRPIKVIDTYISILQNDLLEHIESDDDLKNIKDDMVGDLNQLKYLLGLK